MVSYPFYGSEAGGWLNRNECPTFSGTSGRPKTEWMADSGRNIQGHYNQVLNVPLYLLWKLNEYVK